MYRNVHVQVSNTTFHKCQKKLLFLYREGIEKTIRNHKKHPSFPISEVTRIVQKILPFNFSRKERLLYPPSPQKAIRLEFPKHLQTTLVTLLKLGRATAEDVAKLTGKARAVESAYLNQLCILKVVLESRNRRKAFFSGGFRGFGLVKGKP